MKLRKFMLIALAFVISTLFLLPGEAKAVQTGETTVVSEPTTGVAYKLRMDQNKSSSLLYFNGETESSSVTYRLATTTSFYAAVDVYLEAAGSGYRMYFMDGTTKTYIRIYERTDGNAGYGKGSLALVTTAPSEILTWNSTYNTFVYTADADNSYFLGTYSTYSTFSVSNTSYLSTSTVDVSQFPARLATADELEDLPDVTAMITNPFAETPYLLQMKQLTAGKHLFFNGSLRSASGTNYLCATDELSAAVDVYLEDAGGGYYLYFLNGGTKTYIRVYESTAGQGIVELVTATPSEVWYFDSTYDMLYYYADTGNSYYLGTNGTDLNFNVLNMSTLDDDNVDVTQYPAHLTAAGGVVNSLRYTIRDEEVTIIGIDGSTTMVVIPETVDGYPVRTIAQKAFYQTDGLISVKIPSSVTYIGKDAFGLCSDLTGVYITDLAAWCGITFESAWSNPVYYAKRLYLNDSLVTELVVPEGVTAIHDYAFMYVDLTSVTFPDSLESIGFRAFYDCDELTSVTIPENVTDIGYEAFYYCLALEELNFNAVSMNDLEENTRVFAYSGQSSGGIAVTIGANVQKIPAYLFEPNYYDQVYVTSVTFEEGSACSSIGNYAFYRCKSLTAIALPDSVTEIGECAFSGCASLTSITIPAAVTSLENRVFFGCGALTSVMIPTAVTSIGSCAFYNCDALTSVTIPENVTDIGECAFSGCTGLTEICFNAVNVNDLEERADAFVHEGQSAGCVVRIGSQVQRIPAYLFHFSYITEVIFEEDAVCASIGSNAFHSCGALTSVTLPDSVTEIGAYAFAYCSALEAITFGNSVTTIGDYAFCSCEVLTAITLPDTLETISNSLFSNCTALKSVELGVVATTIGDKAFSGCTALETVELGQKLTTIGSSAFYSCSSLESIVIPPSVTAVGKSAFYGCSGLNNVFIGEGGWNTDICTNEGVVHVSSLASLARINFANQYANPLCLLNQLCLNGELVTELVIPEGVTSIGSYAFAGVGAATSVTIPASVTSIGASAFALCPNLEAIYISDLRTWCESEDNPFQDSYDAKLYLNGQLLTGALVIPEGTTRIRNSAFAYQDQITSVTIPDSVTEICDHAFAQCEALESVSIGSGVTVIENSAFYYCSSLGGTLTIPDSVTKIGDYAFYSCFITELLLGDSVTDIGKGAFGQCSFTELVIPDSVTHIGDYAFNNSDIETVSMGKRVTKVGKNAFGDNRNLEKVYIKDLEAWCKIDFSIADGATDCSNPLNLGSVFTELETNLYLNGELVQDVVIPDSLTRVEALVFAGCASLESVIIPEGVTYVGDYALYGCKNLKAVSVPESALYLCGSVFYETDALEHIAYGGTEEQWNTMLAAYDTAVDLSHVENIHYGASLEEKIICTGSGLYCPTCDKLLLGRQNSTGTHTYTNQTDLICNVCGYEQMLQQIVLWQSPDVYEYEYQETAPEVSPLDVTGGVLALYYDDGGRVEIGLTADMVSGLDVCTLGGQYLEVSYAGMTTYFWVKVVEAVETPIMLTIQSLPNIRSYAVGQSINLSGLELCAFYESGTEAVYYWDVEDVQADLSTPGKKVVSVLYKGLWAQFTVYVHEVEYTTLDSSLYPVMDAAQSEYLEFFYSEDAVSCMFAFDETSYLGEQTWIDVYSCEGAYITSLNDIANLGCVVPSGGFMITARSETEDAAEAQISFSSIQIADPIHTYENCECTVCGKGQAAVGGVTSGVTSGTITGYPDLGSAMESETAPEWLKLYEGTYGETLTLKQDLYIDLNGYDFEAVIITNGYKIYGMDSSTDEYRCDNIGHMYCRDEAGELIVPEPYFKSDITGTTKRYLTVYDAEMEAYSFHRFYLGITHQTLKPSTCGVGYKAVFYGDEQVVAALNSEQAFGFSMQLEGMNPVTRFKSSDSFISGKTITLRIDNFDVENYGETNLYATAILQLADGTVIESTECVMTLRGLMESLNSKADQLSAEQLEAVQAMIEKHVIIKQWDVEDLL